MTTSSTSSTGPVGIDSIAAGGDGVGRLDDGRVVFVPRTAPGDRVTVRPVRDGGRWLRAEAVTFESTSPDRRSAPCPLYDTCGGCQLQHLAYRAQLEAKARVVGDALRRIGKLEVDDPPVDPAPDEFGYRNRVSLSLVRLRGGRVVAGFHARGRPGRIVDVVDECLLPHAAVLRTWTSLRAAWGPGARNLPPGSELRLTVRAVDGGTLLAVEGGRPGGDAAGLVDEVDGLRAVWHAPEGEGWRHLAGDEACFETLPWRRVRVLPGAFAQVNPAVAEALHTAVVKEIGGGRGLRIVDAYCGVGLHGRRLARHGARVVGLELDPVAAAVAREDAPVGFRLIEGPAEDTLPGALPADRVILNPPRGGLDARVPEALRASPPARVVYVSCDPATLARDVARLGPAWRVRRVAALDLFPQTAHVETVVTLDAEHPVTDS
ncbi:MAG: TRAM domain-containing protein [Longimicrobiales bacterium]